MARPDDSETPTVPPEDTGPQYSVEDQIRNLYLTYLHRVPTDGELQSAQTAISGGMNLQGFEQYLKGVAGGLPGGAAPAPAAPDTSAGTGTMGDLFTAPYSGTIPSLGVGGYSPAPTFTPPTADSLKNDPGFQSRLKWGVQGLEQGAAAKGLLNTGGTMKDVLGWGQDYASNEYQNAWNRDLAQYTQTQYNPWLATNQGNQQAGQFNANMQWNNYLQGYNQWHNYVNDLWNKQHTVATE